MATKAKHAQPPVMKVVSDYVRDLCAQENIPSMETSNRNHEVDLIFLVLRVFGCLQIERWLAPFPVVLSSPLKKKFRATFVPY